MTSPQYTSEELAQLWKEAETLLANDETAAYSAWLRLCELGDAHSAHSVAWCLRNGCGVEKNCESAEKYYRLAIERGYFNSCVPLFYMLVENDRRNDAITFARELAQRGIAAGYSLLSSECMDGNVYGGNSLVSAFLAARAFEISEAEGAELGVCYFDGRFFPQIYPYAKYCFEKSGLFKQELMDAGMEFPDFWDELEPQKPSYPTFELTLEECDSIPDPTKLFDEAQRLFYGENPDKERASELLYESVKGGYSAAMYRVFLKNMPDYDLWLNLGADGYGDLKCIETLAALYTDLATFKIGDPMLNKAVHFWNLRKKLHGYVPVDEIVIDFYNDFNTKFAAMMGGAKKSPAVSEHNALLLRSDGSCERITVDFNTLSGLYAPLGCERINCISTQRLLDLSAKIGSAVVMYCDERGMQKQLCENPVAADLSGYDLIYGDVVVCGYDKDYAPLCEDAINELYERLSNSGECMKCLKNTISGDGDETVVKVGEKIYTLSDATAKEKNIGKAFLKQWYVERKYKTQIAGLGSVCYDMKSEIQELCFEELIFDNGECIGAYHDEMLFLFDDDKTHYREKYLGEMPTSADQGIPFYDYYYLCRQ